MDRAERYKQKTIEQLARLNGLVNGRYRRSLELIFKLYLSVYDRIEVNHGQFTTEELNPSNEELVELVMESLALPVPDTQSGD